MPVKGRTGRRPCEGVGCPGLGATGPGGPWRGTVDKTVGAGREGNAPTGGTVGGATGLGTNWAGGGAAGAGGVEAGGTVGPGTAAGCGPGGVAAGPAAGGPGAVGVTVAGGNPNAPKNSKSPPRIGAIMPPPPPPDSGPPPPGGGGPTGDRGTTTPGSNRIGWRMTPPRNITKSTILCFSPDACCRQKLAISVDDHVFGLVTMPRPRCGPRRGALPPFGETVGDALV